MEVIEVDGKKAIQLRRWSSHGHEWIAKIEGFDDKYLYKRKFQPYLERDWSRSGKHGTSTFWIKDGEGYYEYREPKTGGATQAFLYWDGESNEMKRVSKKEVDEYIKSLSPQEK